MAPLAASALLLGVATVTPGPNNLIMLQIGLERGLRAAVRPATGVVLGGLAMLLACHAGIAGLFSAHPASRPVIVIGSAIVVGWLGLRRVWESFAPLTLRASPPARAAPSGNRARGLLGMALFQLINPKSWILVLTVVATAAAQRGSSVPLAALMPLFIVIPYGCLALWAGGGSLAAALLRDARGRARFERVAGMALLLCALLLLGEL
jgi:threonine/homoserine/homoserine lactone efflux protein